MKHAASKFKGRKFVVLSINVDRTEDAFVVPFMRGNRYPFVPLAGGPEHRGLITPANYLLDAQGRQVFRPRLSDAASQKILEGEIEGLLERAATPQ